MRVAPLATLALASSGVSAAILPDFAAGTRFENTQQILAGQLDRFSSQISDFARFFDLKSGDFASKITQFLSEPYSGVSEGDAKSWRDVISEFPSQVSRLRLKSPAKKAFKAGNFDYHVSDSKFPFHSLRVKSTPEDLGIDTVKQYSGYLDIVDEEEDADKHFFYWFFESRNDPKNDPVILWLNGGPGCSSFTGMFFELGPSSINATIQPTYNPFSWNSNASVIFLDQPVNVGFSYSSKSVTNTVAAAKDIYAFLELFFKQFPEYLDLDFHIAGESYAGHYIPHFATEIISHPERSFNFKSVLIGNGLTDPQTQYEFYQPMACGEGGEPAVLSPEQCDRMAATIPSCQRLIEACYNSGSVFACVPASIFCENTQEAPYMDTGRNPYDMRVQCGGSGLCYEELQYVEEYLNLPKVRESLGVEVEAYQGCSDEVFRNFILTGDGMKPSHRNVVELLEAEVPVLIYAGDKDFICNWLGNQAWVDRLEWSLAEKFEVQPVRKWSVNGASAGEVKNYKHFTFLRVFGAGHMVPFDQPENALDMVNRWIGGDYRF